MRILSLTAALLAAAAPKASAPSRDQRLLRLIDREQQIASLLTAGKLAYDAGDFATAAAKWDALLRIDGVPADVERAVRPLLAEARGQSGAGAAVETKAAAQAEEPRSQPKPVTLSVSGTVTGGGAAGPGGAVVSLRRVDGATPKPAALTKPLLQKNKSFVPHVLAVPLGSSINFRNEDEIFHNVFSLSPAAKFDTGLHRAGEDTPVKFDKPGIVELLCNIHSTMVGYLVVVDTPWYAVADAGGAFQIKGVPPGEYEATVWHESANAPLKKRVTVAEGEPLAFNVAGDRRANPFPPDKYGKPRQQQLGY
jgi:plastocyanin